MLSKQCGICKEEKTITEFFKDKYHKTGYTHQCKNCFKQYNEKNRESRKIYYESYKLKNKEKIKKRSAAWYLKNKESYRKKQNESYKKFYADNKQRLIKKSVIYNKKRYDNNPTHRLCHHFSNRLRSSILNKEKNRAFWLVDYTKEQLIKHIESLFKEGMSWGNYGDWHIDHKKPIAAFNFTSYKSKEFKECWSLENLQPLWANENIRKGKKYEEQEKF